MGAGAGKKNKKSKSPPHKPSHPQHRRSKPATSSGRNTDRGGQYGSKNKPSSTTASNRLHDRHKNATNIKEDDFTIAMRYLVKAPIRAARFCFSEIFEGTGVFLEEEEEDFYNYRKNTTRRTRRRTTSRGRSTSERRAARRAPRLHRRMNKQEPSSSPEITTSKRGGGRAGNREDDVDRNRKLRFDEENKRRDFNADEPTSAPAPLRLGLTDDEQSFLKHKNKEAVSFQMPGRGGQEDPINLDRSGLYQIQKHRTTSNRITNLLSMTKGGSSHADLP